jgi:UDP-N-acetylmuramate dehydrogenase
VDQLRAILDDPRIQGLPRLVLGGGSNLVLAGDFDGLVLQVAFKGRSRVQEDADAWYIRAGGGENWHDFVRWTLEMGWPGLENLSLIPGTVGAAPVQNIGAYGLELAEHFYSLRAYDLETGKTVGFDKADCHFGYRDSFFKRHPGRYLIGAVTFRLPKAWRRSPPTPTWPRPSPPKASPSRRRCRCRTPSSPSAAPSCPTRPRSATPAASSRTRWSPPRPRPPRRPHPGMPHYPQPDGRVKLAAGWLIEQAGWKGRRLGPVGCYARQALVLVNHGGARGADVLPPARRCAPTCSPASASTSSPSRFSWAAPRAKAFRRGAEEPLISTSPGEPHDR